MLGNLRKSEQFPRDPLLRIFRVRNKRDQVPQVIEDRLGKEPFVLKPPHVCPRVLALAYLASISIQEQRSVGNHRGSPVKRLVHTEVRRSTWQPLLATYCVCDFHFVVINHYCEVVRWEPVGFEQHSVVEQRVLKRHLTPDRVSKRCVAGVRHSQADHRPFGVSTKCLTLSLGFAETKAVVLRGQFCSLLGFAHLIKTFGGTPAPVRIALGHQLFGNFEVSGQALGLTVRCKWPTPVRALLPFNPQPRQAVIDQLFGAFKKALLIGVLDTNNERPIEFACNRSVNKCYEHVSDVNESGRGRR